MQSTFTSPIRWCECTFFGVHLVSTSFLFLHFKLERKIFLKLSAITFLEMQLKVELSTFWKWFWFMFHLNLNNKLTIKLKVVFSVLRTQSAINTKMKSGDKNFFFLTLLLKLFALLKLFSSKFQMSLAAFTFFCRYWF